MRIEQIIVIGILLAFACEALHLQSSRYDYTITDYSDFIPDYNFTGTNLNYYFGNLPPETYYQWLKINNQKGKLYEKYTCPFYKPYAYYNELNYFKGCIDCSLVSIQDPAAKSLFNLETRQCQVCTYGKTAICNQLLDNLTKINDAAQNSSSQVNPLPSFDLCPPQRPLYNPDTKLCDDCPPNQQFDGPTQSCQPFIFTTNLKASNIVMPLPNSLDEQKHKIQQENPSRLVQQCPKQSPYLQVKICISCLDGQLFNLTSQGCTKCPIGTYYDAAVFNCQPELFYSDVFAGNLVSQTQFYDAWRSKAEESKKLSPRMTQCPKQKPYAVKGKCIGCDGGTPLFNIDLQQCSSCSQGRYYDAEKKMCLGYYKVSSSLKSMIGNIA